MFAYLRDISGPDLLFRQYAIAFPLHQDHDVMVLHPNAIGLGVIVAHRTSSEEKYKELKEIGVCTNVECLRRGIETGRTAKHQMSFWRPSAVTSQAQGRSFYSFQDEVDFYWPLEEGRYVRTSQTCVYLRVFPQETYVYASETRCHGDMHPNASRRPMLDYFKTEEENKSVEVPVGMVPWWNLYTGVKVAIPYNGALVRPHGPFDHAPLKYSSEVLIHLSCVPSEFLIPV